MIWHELPHPRGVIVDPEHADIPENVSALMALCGLLYRFAEDVNFDAIVTYATRHRREVGEFHVSSCVRREPALQRWPAFIPRPDLPGGHGLRPLPRRAQPPRRRMGGAGRPCRRRESAARNDRSGRPRRALLTPTRSAVRGRPRKSHMWRWSNSTDCPERLDARLVGPLGGRFSRSLMRGNGAVRPWTFRSGCYTNRYASFRSPHRASASSIPGRRRARGT